MYNDMLDFKFFKDLFWDFLLAISNNLFGASDEVLPKKFNSKWFKSDLQNLSFRNDSPSPRVNYTRKLRIALHSVQLIQKKLIFCRNNSNAELLKLSSFKTSHFNTVFLHFNISFCCISTQFTFQHHDFYISTHFCISTPVLKCKSVEM